MRFAKTTGTGFVVFFLLFVAQAAIAADQGEQGSSNSEVIFLKNGTIHSMGEAGTFVGSIVVSNGKIEAVGEKIETPQDAKVYELGGFHVVPGLIESRGNLWMTNAATSEGNTKAELNVVDAIDPWSEDWRELATQGITSVYVQPASSSFVGGYGAVLRVGPHGSADGIVMKDQVAIQVAIGTKGTTSKDRFTQFKALEKLIEAAKDKKKKTESKKENDQSAEEDEDNEKDKDVDSEGEKKEEDESDSKQGDKKDDEAKKDVTKEIFKRVLNKEIPLFVEVHHSDSLQRILQLAKKHDIRVVLDGLTQVESCSAELEAAGVPMVLGPFMEMGEPPAYRKDADLDWFADSSCEEKLWSLGSFPASARFSRLLRMQAAMAIRSGVDQSAALAAITSNAARMLGVADRVGTLESGKQADIAVFAGDPLDPSTPTRLVISHGQVIVDRQLDAVAQQSETIAKALPARLPDAFAVKSTRILQDGKFSSGTLVIKKGKIHSVGDLSEENELPLFELGDTFITPGLVVANSTLGQSATIGDSTESDASHLRAVDAVDPTTKLARKMLHGGFVHVGISPGQSNTSSGVVGHLRLGAGDYVAKPNIANQFVLAKASRSPERFPSSLNGQLKMLDGLLSGDLTPSSVFVTATIAESIAQEKLANMQAVAEGKRRAILVANSDLEIKRAIEFAEREDLRLVLLSSGKVGQFAKRMADGKFGLIVPALQGDEFDTVIAEFVDASNSGVPLAFAGDSAQGIRNTAALLINAGASRDKVFAGLTAGGAELVGMEQTSLVKGAPADFVVWSDDPFQLAAQPISIVVAGQSVSLN